MIDLSTPLLPVASAAEELILSLFWSELNRAMTVRQIATHPRLESRAWAYTTVATIVLRMEKKSLLRRISHSRRAISYEVALPYSAYRQAVLLALDKRYPQAAEPAPEAGLDKREIL